MQTTSHTSPKGTLIETPNSRQVTAFRAILLLWLLSMLPIFVWKGLIAHTFTIDYCGWQLSEWMINYEAGFVRRGLTGQLLYLAYEWHPFPLRTAVEWIGIISMVGMYAALVRLFRQERWSLTFLFAPFLLMPALAFPYWVRKDFILLAMAWGIFKLYARFLAERKAWEMIALQLLLALLLLIHEATFFFVVPFLGVYTFYTRMKARRSVGSAVRSVALLVLPACVVMALVCLHKGSPEVARQIWDSWEACMTQYPLPIAPDRIGDGVEALEWGTLHTFKYHLIGGWGGMFVEYIPGALVHLLNFAGIYYLATRLNTVNPKWNKIAPFDAVKLSNVLLVQGFFLLPMFTVLSVDFGRTIPYWVLTSFVLYHYFKGGLDTFPTRLTRLSERLQNGLSRVRWLSSPWAYLAVLLCLPYSHCGTPEDTYSPLWRALYFLFRQVCAHLS